MIGEVSGKGGFFTRKWEKDYSDFTGKIKQKVVPRSIS